MQPKQQQTGLTMVELMIVVTITAILAGLAAPAFIELINNTRMTSTMSQLTSDLNRARSEAIKRNRRMLVCVRGTQGGLN
jgi:type IV fimbrial biogenesis protein FimT